MIVFNPSNFALGKGNHLKLVCMHMDISFSQWLSSLLHNYEAWPVSY